MEFPETGEECAEKLCKQLDFLPFTCPRCSLIFCKQHLQPDSHHCAKYHDNYVVEKTKTKTHKCDLCETRTPCEMPCVKCKKHFCLAHRHHGCLDPTEEERTKDLDKYLKPKRDFVEAKKVVEQEVMKNLNKSKNTAMANKVQLMRLKSRSVGQNAIPISERRYFLVYYPLEAKNPDKSKGVFVSIQWSVGKVIDYTAELLKIKNTNNISVAKKLKLFNRTTGDEIAETLDVKLSGLFESGVLVDGQNLVLEYSESGKIDPSQYI